MTTTSIPRNTDRTFAAITLAGGALAAIGSFLPWVSATISFLGTSVTRSGLDNGGDGIVTLIVGLLVAAIGAARLATSVPPWVARTPIVLAALLAWIVVLDLGQVAERVAANTSPLVIVSTGPGLYLILVAAAVSVFGSCRVERVTA